MLKALILSIIILTLFSFDNAYSAGQIISSGAAPVIIKSLSLHENTIAFETTNGSFVIDDLTLDDNAGQELVANIEKYISQKSSIGIDYAIVRPNPANDYTCNVVIAMSTRPTEYFYILDKTKSYLKIDPLSDYRFMMLNQQISMSSKPKTSQPNKEFTFFQITSSTGYNEAVKILESNKFYFDKKDPTNIGGTGKEPLGIANYNIDNDPLFKSINIHYCKSTNKIVSILIRLTNGLEVYKTLVSKYGEPNFCDGSMKPPFCISYWGDIDKQTLFRKMGNPPLDKTFMSANDGAVTINFGQNQTECQNQSGSAAQEKSNQLEKRAGAAF